MAHYFTNEYVKSKEVKTKCIIKNKEVELITDNGVFSKRGLDFGTRSLLETIEDLNGEILDFGCGYGPIAIYIKKTFDCTVDAIDINLRALNLAKQNAKLNNADINIFESNLYENVTKKYDYIVTNPPIRVGKKILLEILLKAKEHLKTNGQLIFVIHKDQGAKTIAKILETEYQIEIKNKNKGFYIIYATNN